MLPGRPDCIQAFCPRARPALVHEGTSLYGVDPKSIEPSDYDAMRTPTATLEPP